MDRPRRGGSKDTSANSLAERSQCMFQRKSRSVGQSTLVFSPSGTLDLVTEPEGLRVPAPVA
jgi:hypothetical protein